MAIPIIGAQSADRPEKALPEPDVDLPPPSAAPEARRVLEAKLLKNLLTSKDALVRGFAVEQISARNDPKLTEALIPLIHDGDDAVAFEAIDAIENQRLGAAVDDLKKRFATAKAHVASASASALGRIDPDALLASLKKRGRLDDESYAATATALAISGSDEVSGFLARALDRTGVLSADRRSALFGAALLNGDPALVGRVIGTAVDESKEAEPAGASLPSRAAFAVLANLPMEASRQDVGLEVYDHARELIDAEVVEELEEADARALIVALQTKNVARVLEAFSAVLRIEVDERPANPTSTLGEIARRRRGLLEALVERASTIGRLDIKASAVFVASAAHAAAIMLAGELGESTSPAMMAVSRALEGTPSAKQLAEKDIGGLAAVFSQQTPRQMRAIVTAMTRQSFRRSETLERFARALYRAGHGRALVEATAEIPDGFIQTSVVRASPHELGPAEATVVELLGQTPLEEAQVDLLLAIADEVRTERVALALGRRFIDLRKIDPSGVARSILRAGDPRLIPLLESRAFPEEPEEVAWVVLSTVHSTEESEKLTVARARMKQNREGLGERPPEVPLTLQCEACGETLHYAFERVYLDVEAKERGGDPAFVGPVVCKACGTQDRLLPTPTAEQVLTGHMLEFIQAMQAGVPVGRPLVSPAQTHMDGRKIGMAAALRELTKRIDASPDSIRPRLHRARLRLILKRTGLSEDLDAIRQVDPTSVEASALEATSLMRDKDYDAAMDKAASVMRQLDADADGVRLYDAEDPKAFRMSIEDLVLELSELGAKVPSGIDVRPAQARRERFETEMLRVQQERARQARRASEKAGHGPEPAEEASVLERARPREPSQAALREAGRNDPCPCGSGKKFKKCHGARG